MFLFNLAQKWNDLSAQREKRETDLFTSWVRKWLVLRVLYDSRVCLLCLSVCLSVCIYHVRNITSHIKLTAGIWRMHDETTKPAPALYCYLATYLLMQDQTDSLLGLHRCS